MGRKNFYQLGIFLLLGLTVSCKRDVSPDLSDEGVMRIINVYFVDTNQQNVIGLDAGECLPNTVEYKDVRLGIDWSQADWFETSNGYMYSWQYFREMMHSIDDYNRFHYDRTMYFRFPGNDIDTINVQKIGADSVKFYWNGELCKTITAAKSSDTLYIIKKMQ